MVSRKIINTVVKLFNVCITVIFSWNGIFSAACSCDYRKSFRKNIYIF